MKKKIMPIIAALALLACAQVYAFEPVSPLQTFGSWSRCMHFITMGHMRDGRSITTEDANRICAGWGLMPTSYLENQGNIIRFMNECLKSHYSQEQCRSKAADLNLLPM